MNTFFYFDDLSLDADAIELYFNDNIEIEQLEQEIQQKRKSFLHRLFSMFLKNENNVYIPM